MPIYITKFYNLQTLRVCGLYEFFKNIFNLINLIYFDIEHKDKKMHVYWVTYQTGHRSEEQMSLFSPISMGYHLNHLICININLTSPKIKKK